MKIGEIVYYCLDSIKAASDDAFVNEDHIIFLLGKYRSFLLQQYHNIKKFIPESNYQIVCLDLDVFDSPLCVNNTMLKSIQQVPDIIPISKPSILLYNGMENEVFEYVPFQRLKSVGYNNLKRNFIYCSIGTDKHLYLSFCNPQARHLEKVRLRAIFEDYMKALELSCDDDNKCEELEQTFPIEDALVSNLIQAVVKDVLGVYYRPKDNINNAEDNIPEMVNGGVQTKQNNMSNAQTE